MKLAAIRSGVCFLMSLMVLVSSPVQASEAIKFKTSDYRLGEKGILEGKVVNQSGQPAAGLTVRLFHDGRVIAKTVSDENGRFAVDRLRTGEHAVQMGASLQQVRLWEDSAAPPATQSRMVIVVDEEVVRGQANGGGTLGSMLVPAAVIGGASAVTYATTFGSASVPASP